MADTARTRADIDLHQNPSLTAPSVDRYPPDCLVEILETQDSWVKVKSVRLRRTVSGFMPKESLIFPGEKVAAFPALADVKPFYSVPPDLKLADFQAWLAAPGKPSWLPDAFWNTLTADQIDTLTQQMTASIAADRARWDAWVADVTDSGRQAEATMDEWVVTVQGGRDVFAIRDHYIYKQPVMDANYWGCAAKGQVMRWTGKMRSKKQSDGNVRTFYEVNFFRMSKAMNGWFRADIAAEYLYPYPEIDPTEPANKDKVFDLSKPILRHPQDQEMIDAKAMRYTGAQYIDVKRATGKALRHFALCGEFCCAALSGQDIIPTLKGWIDSGYSRVASILSKPHEGTGVYDLQTLLKTLNLQGEEYSTIPTSPQAIKAKLVSGKFAIAGCGINSAGKIVANGSIRHWVVLEDVMPVGNSGWVRVYNPFQNCEEVYTYDTFIASGGYGSGMWVSSC